MELSETTARKPAHKATLSRSQGREGWSVIFRHPVRVDPATGKPGRRVRGGLGTTKREEAEQLVAQMNEILADASYWELAAREIAIQRFNPRIVEIFYRELVPEGHDHFAIREQHIALPSTAQGYRRALFLGTTGAGKTTLVRQILGTDQVKERFPSTSTAKTTVADLEVVIAPGSYEAVVTFLSQLEVRTYLEECISAAVLAAYREADDAELVRRLLRHVDQRFRLDYVLGSGFVDESEEQEDDDEEEVDQTDMFDVRPEELGDIDLSATNEILRSAVSQLREIARSYGDKIKTELEATEQDGRVIDELFEEELDNLLRGDDLFHEIADQLMDEISKRFELLTLGTVHRTKQGWPLSWTYASEDRRSFVRSVLQFSSNFAPYFGRLLTPLVNGIRVSGPFVPRWGSQELPKLVLMDGEGLGHAASSAASVPTAISRRFEEVDAVVLVDSAKQPMQAAPQAVMRAVVSSGNVAKLAFCFTHFDAVRGDNIPTVSARRNHVLASTDSVLPGIGEDLGPYAEAALRRRRDCACFFVGGIQKTLNSEKAADRRTIDELKRLLKLIESIGPAQIQAPGKPIYDRMKLGVAISAAAASFQDSWRARLGLVVKPNFVKEHWTRIKALARRIAFGWDDQYDNLTPVADLLSELQRRIFVSIQQPARWGGPEPSDKDKEAIYSDFADKVSRRLIPTCSRRVQVERVNDWQRAYNLSGVRSTFARARIIADEIYDKAAPIPDVTSLPGTDDLLEEVMIILKEAAADTGVTVM
jgi:hypothetical protein